MFVSQKINPFVAAHFCWVVLSLRREGSDAGGACGRGAEVETVPGGGGIGGSRGAALDGVGRTLYHTLCRNE